MWGKDFVFLDNSNAAEFVRNIFDYGMFGRNCVMERLQERIFIDRLVVRSHFVQFSFAISCDLYQQLCYHYYSSFYKALCVPFEPMLCRGITSWDYDVFTSQRQHRYLPSQFNWYIQFLQTLCNSAIKQFWRPIIPIHVQPYEIIIHLRIGPYYLRVNTFRLMVLLKLTGIKLPIGLSQRPVALVV